MGAANAVMTDQLCVRAPSVKSNTFICTFASLCRNVASVKDIHANILPFHLVGADLAATHSS